jgi:hypothetical protein
MVPRRPIFEKCSHLREKEGVLTKISNSRNRLSRIVRMYSRGTAVYTRVCTLLYSTKFGSNVHVLYSCIALDIYYSCSSYSSVHSCNVL